MMPARPTTRVEELRARITRLFHDATVPRSVSDGCGAVLPSGWAALDALLDGGLATGQTASLEGTAGAGTLALAASWARSAGAAGEPVVVIDADASTAPVAWVAPRRAVEDAPWVVAPPRRAEGWAAADIALRSGAFGLVIVIDAGPGPPSAGGRLRRLVRDGSSRLLVVGGAPFTPDVRIALEAREVAWVCAPIGDVPRARRIAVRLARATNGGRSIDGAGSSFVEVWRDDLETDRLRVRSRAPDRRASSAREGSARREAGARPRRTR
jgi:hypothetical protein